MISLFNIFKMWITYNFFVLFIDILYFIRSRLCNKIVHAKLRNKWILITGATDGIGKALAIKFAKLKYNLIIVGRNKEKLNDVKKEIIAFEVKCVSLCHDFNTECNFSEVLKYDIGLLVNNVGACSQGPTFFEEDVFEEIINVNLLNTFKITKMVLNGMKRNQMGYIINIGSLLGDIPMPLLATYASSKAMIKAWSESLYTECGPFKVNVECMNTGYVATKMSKIRKTSLFCPSADVYAGCISKHFGSGIISYAYFPHLLNSWALSLIPRRCVGIGSYFYQNMIRGKIDRKRS